MQQKTLYQLGIKLLWITFMRYENVI